MASDIPSVGGSSAGQLKETLLSSSWGPVVISLRKRPFQLYACYQKLETVIKEKEKNFKGSDRHRIFYMALPPSVFIDVATGLKKNNYSPHGFNRIVVEKPFGMDLPTSRELMEA
ncbi:hypothetical protein KEM48_007166 [Puccinia striiformis f. sp. tritici PST-130]|nr:hypothetical protein KEM48_007166 [Puccinia striiformis f. sp. tritici PST-130]